MKSRLLSGRALASVGLACAVALSSPVIVQAVVGSAAYAADDENKVSPEMAKPLQAAQTAVKEKKYGEAMAKLREADAISKKSAYEQSVIEQLRLNAAVGSDEPGLAAKAYDYLSQNGGLQGQLKTVYAQAIAGSYMKAKDLGSAATWYSRYFQAGGTDLATRTALAQAYFFNNDFGNAQKATQQAIDAYTAAGQTPTEALYNLLANCALKQNDKKTYGAVLEQMVALYPKPDYWADLIHQVANKPGASKLSLDVYRIQDAVGALNKTQEYMEYAELAIQAGIPGEAKTVVDKGYKAGTLGAGGEAERHGRLRTMTTAKIDADKPGLAAAETDAGTQPNGQALINVGMDYYGYGQYDKAISLIQAGIAKGGLKSPDEAKLHLGIVQLAAGKKADGQATLKSIKSGDAVNDLARLWIIKTNSHAAG